MDAAALVAMVHGHSLYQDQATSVLCQFSRHYAVSSSAFKGLSKAAVSSFCRRFKLLVYTLMGRYGYTTQEMELQTTNIGEKDIIKSPYYRH